MISRPGEIPVRVNSTFSKHSVEIHTTTKSRFSGFESQKSIEPIWTTKSLESYGKVTGPLVFEGSGKPPVPSVLESPDKARMVQL